MRRKYNATFYRNNAASLASFYRDCSARWLQKNPDKAAMKKADRRSKKLQATPAWANRFFMSEAYHLAQLRTKATGIAWAVDHIVPLNSRYVCGLHVEHNLAVIPARANSSKGNRYWPDMP